MKKVPAILSILLFSSILYGQQDRIQTDSVVSKTIEEVVATGLTHPLAERQFKNDIEAMSACDACVLVLPCGRSAHTEAGWFAGQGKKVFAYIPDKDIFEQWDMK